MSVLFIGPLPEPMTEQALAYQVFLDELEKHHRVEVINLRKSSYEQGINSIGRVFDVLGIVFSVWRKRNSAEVIYHSSSESFAGSMRGLLIYLVCFRRLSRMIVDLNGGAGMREIIVVQSCLALGAARASDAGAGPRRALPEGRVRPRGPVRQGREGRRGVRSAFDEGGRYSFSSSTVRATCPGTRGEVMVVNRRGATSPFGRCRVCRYV